MHLLLQDLLSDQEHIFFDLVEDPILRLLVLLQC